MQSIKPLFRILVATCLAASPLHAAENQPDSRETRHGISASHSQTGHTRIAADLAQQAGIKTSQAGPGSLERTLTTYGRLTAAPEQIARVGARFPGIVTRITVRLGDQVAKGDLLAQVESNASLTSYDLHSPIDGVVIERRIGLGETTDGQHLFTIADLSVLWAELQVFPGQRAAVEAGQTVRLTAEGIDRQATIDHLLPAPGNIPHTLARAKLDNPSGELNPGLLVKGDIVVEAFDVPLAVENRALHSVQGQSVVFMQVDDTYESQPLELGRSDGALTEVLGGMRAGDRYVVENSYLIKADIEKSATPHHH